MAEGQTYIHVHTCIHTYVHTWQEGKRSRPTAMPVSIPMVEIDHVCGLEFCSRKRTGEHHWKEPESGEQLRKERTCGILR